MSEPDNSADIHGQIQAQFEAYVDGGLGEHDRSAVEEHLASCDECERAFEQYHRELTGLGDLLRVSAPHHFEAGVEETIRRRSDGRFFGRRAFGDRVPFELLAVLAIALALGAYLLLRTSDTGSLKIDTAPDSPPPQGAADVLPRL